MGIKDYILLGLIMIWLVLVIINLINQKKRGGCISCSQRERCVYKSSGNHCGKGNITKDSGKKK